MCFFFLPQVCLRQAKNGILWASIMSLLHKRIEAILTQIRPAIQLDGGDLEFVDFLPETGVVMVRMHGACVNCPMSQVTLKMGIEATLKDAMPEITEVIALT